MCGPSCGGCSSPPSSHIQEGVQVLAEMDFLARVEQAERRDNMQVNPAIDPTPKYSAVPADSAGLPQAAGLKAASSKEPKPRIQRDRPSKLKINRVHDETGGAQQQHAKQKQQLSHKAE